MSVAKSKKFSRIFKEFYWTVTRAVGLSVLHDGRFVYRHLNRAFGWLLFPIYFGFAELLKAANVRFIDAKFNGEPYGIMEHVGHCTMDFDTYLKGQILAKRHIFPIFLCAGRIPANETLIAHWSEHIHFVRSKVLEWFLRPFMSFHKLVDSTDGFSAVRGAAATMYDVERRWGNREPLLHLSEQEIARGEAELEALGVPKGSWFVCVHSREGGYIPNSEWQHSFRNSKIENYKAAMEAIVARGGWCIRVGDPTMRPLDPMPGVVNYAHSASRSDWMDVFLCARCRFFLGNTSGLFGLAAVFGRPSALANMVPLTCSYSCFPENISIPKLLMDESKDRIIPFPDAFADAASDFRDAPEFEARHLKCVDNSSEEIAELAIEMMDRLDGRAVYDSEDIDLQNRFLALIQPHHYCWQTASRIGRDFLLRHRALLTVTDDTAEGRS